MVLSSLLEQRQFSLSKRDKEQTLFPLMLEAHQKHLRASEEYASIHKSIFGGRRPSNFEELPYLQVGLFKSRELRSISEEQVFKTLSSSGTSNSGLSRIFLDRETARTQTNALSSIMQSILGKKRLPMLIVDTRAVYSDQKSFGARGAGVLGLSVFGKKHTYALDENMNIAEEGLSSFLEEHSGKEMLIFGFTFMIWKYLKGSGLFREYDLSKAVLVHSGGWKKMIEMAVDNPTFRRELKQHLGIDRIYNFYGMVEQVGSVYIENELGYLHCPNFSDIIIRNPEDLSVQSSGKPGLIQVISPLATSYPGISILTEDIGVLMGEDDPGIPWKGKFFKVMGRAPKAEIRGCSDTFASTAT